MAGPPDVQVSVYRRAVMLGVDDVRGAEDRLKVRASEGLVASPEFARAALVHCYSPVKRR